MSTDEVSSRISILRFPLIVGVVFIHGYFTSIKLAQGSIGVTHNPAWVEFVRFFISQGIARIAVPLFFAMSGYLFFLQKWSWEQYVCKLKKRLHTLLIPLLFWNSFTLVVFAIAQSIPQTKIFFSGQVWPPVHSFSALNYINALLGLFTLYPIALQFWFIRDLMALVVVAPAIHFVLARRLAMPFLIVLFCLWCLTAWPILWPSIEASFFFSFGAYLAHSGKSVTSLDRLGPWIAVMFLGLLILYSAFPSGLFYFAKVVIVFGVPSAWWLAGVAIRNAALRSTLMKMGGASFFVFAAHEPLMEIIRRLSYKFLMPTGGAEVMALYFLIPLFVIALLVVLHGYLLRIMPSFLGFITGRSGRRIYHRAEARIPSQGWSTSPDESFAGQSH